MWMDPDHSWMYNRSNPGRAGNILPPCPASSDGSNQEGDENDKFDKESEGDENGKSDMKSEGDEE
ncbi:hypothetical protein H5410_046953 [Solanum commersonii]|uniref:Uncharacterized protein n=1 Tax=Solanum commersonii TaxID=4109 RepID=A0A9J5XFU5_SOLCO|nr:hypothetical protein H5410_046953 [Solanum commersonii]